MEVFEMTRSKQEEAETTVRRETQIEKDAPHLGAPPWKQKPVRVLPQWTPKVGDTLTGEFAQHGDGIWGSIGFGETIKLRTAPHTDTPFRISGRESVHALRELKPQIGNLLRFKRLKDGDGPFPLHIVVEPAQRPGRLPR